VSVLSRVVVMKSSKPNKYVISFRVSSAERDVLLEQAKKTGETLSLLVRKKLGFQGTSNR